MRNMLITPARQVEERKLDYNPRQRGGILFSIGEYSFFSAGLIVDISHDSEFRIGDSNSVGYFRKLPKTYPIVSWGSINGS